MYNYVNRQRGGLRTLPNVNLFTARNAIGTDKCVMLKLKLNIDTITKGHV